MRWNLPSRATTRSFGLALPTKVKPKDWRGAALLTRAIIIRIRTWRCRKSVVPTLPLKASGWQLCNEADKTRPHNYDQVTCGGDLQAVAVIREKANTVQVEGTKTLKGEQVMGKNERRMARKPATKFPNLRKKLQKAKIQSKQVKKK